MKRYLLGAALCAAGWGCDEGEVAAPDAGATHAAVEPGQIRYHLDWDDTGIEHHADGTWSTTNDLGYAIAVHRGWMTSYQISMVPCWLIEGTARRAPFDLGRALWSLIGGVAHAGHDDEPDPSVFDVAYVEPLVDRAPLEFGLVDGIPSESYCKVHYLVARADDEALNRPDAVDFDRISLHLEGTWQIEGGDPVPFEIHTDFNVGRNLGIFAPGMTDVEGADLRLDPTDDGIEITVYRRLQGLFAGLDFATLEPDRLTRNLMLNVPGALWLEARVGDEVTSAR